MVLVRFLHVNTTNVTISSENWTIASYTQLHDVACNMEARRAYRLLATMF